MATLLFSFRWLLYRCLHTVAMFPFFESAKGSSSEAIAQKLGCYVDTVNSFQKDLSTRKKRFDSGTSTTVNERDMRNIDRELFRKPG